AAPPAAGTTSEALSDESRLRQPRGSTVPPDTVRKRATTDHGTPIATEDGDGRSRSPRGSTPPGEQSRSGLIVPPAETASAVEEALSGITEAATPEEDTAVVTQSMRPATEPPIPAPT